MQEEPLENRIDGAGSVTASVEGRSAGAAIERNKNGVSAEMLAELFPVAEVIELKEPSVAGGALYRLIKRVFDVCVAGIALIVFAVPMAVIALRVKAETPGPAIYAQERVGQNGRRFLIYKFRSMYEDAEAKGACWTAHDDPRVTRFGTFMRERRIDELPQFWNVLKGDMSLVGPRPERPEFCEVFEERINGWSYRTMVKPGLSGLAQVMGGYDLLPGEKIRFDLHYIEHRRVSLDLKVVFKTLWVVITGKGAR